MLYVVTAMVASPPFSHWNKRYKDGIMSLGIWHSKQAQDANITAVDVNPKKTVVAMGDCQGYISMFRYPCTKKGVSDSIQTFLDNFTCKKM